MTAEMSEDRRGLEAAAWWMRLQKDESVGFSAEFRDWVAIPANEQKFHAIALAMDALDGFGASPAIVEMHRSTQTWFEKLGVDRRPRKAVYAMAAAGLLLSIGAGAYHLWPRRSYHTSINERHAVALEDGSRVLLDADSNVDVRYSKNARMITLTRGRARFNVVHDTARPFSVSAGNETVVAVGTSFDVELRKSKVLVTLIQGRVRIEGAPGSAMRTSGPIQLSAGQQLITSVGGGTPTIAPADFGVTQAWETGHLVFHDERLADAAEQINRYTDHPVTVAASAASFRLSGVFNTGDVKSFVSAATEFFPVDAVSNSEGAITLRKSP